MKRNRRTRRNVAQLTLKNINSDLYGPIKLALTLVAVLLFDMKASGRVATVTCFTQRCSQKQADATLMGTAMASALGYWLSCSGAKNACHTIVLKCPVLVYGLSFVFNTAITVFEILSLVVCMYVP